MLRPAPRTAGAAARRLAPAPPPPRRPRTPHDRRPAVVAALPDAAFSAATVAAVAAYAVVAGRPRGRLATFLTASPLIPALGAALYITVALLCVPGDALTAVRSALAAARPRPDVAAFAAVFATHGATAAAWVHLLTLDFVTAAWVARDARRVAAAEGGGGGGGGTSRHPPSLPVAHSLVLCFMAGPLGLLSHLATRAVWRWRAAG